MKTLQFSKKSWHYWLAYRLGPLDDYSQVTDFCRYVRAVMIGGLFGLAILAAGILVTYMLGDFLAWLVVCAINWQYVQPDWPAQIILMVLCALGIIGGLVGVVFGAYFTYQKTGEYLNERAYRKKYGDGSAEYVPPPPSFLECAWKTFKDKTCFRVELN